MIWSAGWSVCCRELPIASDNDSDLKVSIIIVWFVVNVAENANTCFFIVQSAIAAMYISVKKFR